MDFLVGIAKGIWAGEKAQRFDKLAMLLGWIAPMLRSVDPDDDGPDDIAADFAVAAAKIFANLARGNVNKAIAAIDAAIDILTVLRKRVPAGPVVNN